MTLRVALTEQRLSNGERLFKSGLDVAQIVAQTHAGEDRYANKASNASLLTQVWSLNKPASDDFIEAILRAVDYRIKSEPASERRQIKQNVMNALSSQRITYATQRSKLMNAEPDLGDYLLTANRIWIYLGGLENPGKINAVKLLPVGKIPISVVTDRRTAAVSFWAHFLAAEALAIGADNSVELVCSLAATRHLSVSIAKFTYPASVMLIEVNEKKIAFMSDLDSQNLRGTKLSMAMAAAWEKHVLQDLSLFSVDGEASGFSGNISISQVLEEAIMMSELIKTN